MLVDDDSDDSEIFSEALRDLDPSIHFIHAIDGFNALEILREKQPGPDLIFLDINMPRMDGWECLKELKKQDLYRNIPVIMYSTSSHQTEKETAIKLGAHKFICKPDNFTTVKNIIKAAIGKA
jgi:CheY-like chemotaxis protein